MSRSVVIVGAGHAGCQLAVSLREAHFDGAIALLGEEAETPYQRPPLSKTYLLGKLAAGEFALKPIEYFVQKNIELVSSAYVTGIDRHARIITVNGQRIYRYDKLVIATGSQNRTLGVPGENLEGVLSLRTIRDAADLRQRLLSTGRLVIIGAGFIGMEVAAVARQLGIQVVIVERASRVLARAVSNPVSEYLVTRHREKGVGFEFETGVQYFDENNVGRVRGLRLTDGRFLSTNLALVAVGTEPVSHLAELAGLRTGNGIWVDETLTTEDPHIHAIGDCTNYPHVFLDGRRVRVESVQNAVDQARCLAATLNGTPTRYAHLPWFWSNQWDIRLQIAGIGDKDDETVIRGNPADGGVSPSFAFLTGV
jgi:3-phenylpropionate/trans-cinnamate dioxygenase ferredoxin reductase component